MCALVRKPWILDGNPFAEWEAMMSKRPLRSPLVGLLAAGSLVIVACSASTEPDVIGSPYSHHVGTPAQGSGSEGTGSTGSTGSKTSTGSTGSTNGTTSGTTGTGTTGTTGTTTGDPGGTTITPPVTPAAPTYTVAVDNAAPSLNLADETVVNVTVTSTQSWAGGAVTLTTGTLPTDVTGTFDNATVNVTATMPGTAKLTLKSVSSTVGAATPFTVIGTTGTVTMDAPATVTVKSIITLEIPVNVDSAKPGFGTVNITAPADIANNPVTVLFKNIDSTPHEIHADNPKQGLSHGTGTFSQGQTDTPRLMIAKGSFGWHLHDEANSNGPDNPGTINIQ